MFSKRLSPRRWSKNALHYAKICITGEIGYTSEVKRPDHE
jgi:hypothetical protein